jgi:hypothetical protein
MNWHTNWAWGLPLIVLTVVIHVPGLGVINRVNPHLTALFVVVMAAATLVAAVLHAIEGTVWPVAHRLGALPDNRVVMLCSLSAITSYGHAQIFLDPNYTIRVDRRLSVLVDPEDLAARKSGAWQARLRAALLHATSLEWPLSTVSGESAIIVGRPRKEARSTYTRNAPPLWLIGMSVETTS